MSNKRIDKNASAWIDFSSPQNENSIHAFATIERKISLPATKKEMLAMYIENNADKYVEISVESEIAFGYWRKMGCKQPPFSLTSPRFSNISYTQVLYNFFFTNSNIF